MMGLLDKMKKLNIKKLSLKKMFPSKAGKVKQPSTPAPLAEQYESSDDGEAATTLLNDATFVDIPLSDVEPAEAAAPVIVPAPVAAPETAAPVTEPVVPVAEPVAPAAPVAEPVAAPAETKSEDVQAADLSMIQVESTSVEADATEENDADDKEKIVASVFDEIIDTAVAVE